MPRTLYVRRFTLKDIRLFTKLDIQFSGRSAVIVGDNGDGKSTVLRSLAMGLCDESSAAALFRELHGEYVRRGSEQEIGTILVELGGRGERGSPQYVIETRIHSLETFERVEQRLFRLEGGRRKRVSQDAFPWEQIFSSGYGAGLRVQGTSDFDYYLTADAVYPLFRYDVPLQNPELAIRRLVDAAELSRGEEGREEVLTQVKVLLSLLLQLDNPGKVALEPNGIFIKTNGEKVGLSALSDGFRGTVTWILDLVAWWFVYRRRWSDLKFLNVGGVVIIDEIEQHLHPVWQRNIVRLLEAAFPRVQFIATTHSPLVASGCEGIPVHRLVRGQHSVEYPYGWRAEDVYEWMGLQEGSRSIEFSRHVLDRIRDLDLKRLNKTASKGELAELRKLENQLEHQLPESDPLRSIMAMQNIRRFLNAPSDRQKR